MTLEESMREITKVLDDKEKRQDKLIPFTREIVRDCAHAIKALHMSDTEECARIVNSLDEKMNALKELDKGLENISSICYQEYAEIKCLLAFLEEKDLPSYDELGMEFMPYLGGLADCVGELRRAFQLSLMKGDKEKAQYLFDKMNYVYDNLMVLKYSSSLVGPLKRKQDVLRGQIEQARSEMLRNK